MAATFRTRPFQLVFRPATWRPLPAASSLHRFAQGLSSSASRRGSKPGRKGGGSTAFDRQTKDVFSKTPSPDMSMREGTKHMTSGLPTRLIKFQAPRTFINPPWRAYLSSPRALYTLLWARAWQRALDLFQVVLYKISSKPSFLTRARFQARRSSLVPTAKALHRAFADAMARGDREALRRVCVDHLYEHLSGALAARPRLQRYDWSLLAYTRPWLYPRLVDHKLAVMAEKGFPLPVVVRQAVVSISSRQRLVRVVDGAAVPGSERVADVVEHLVLVASVDPVTHETKEWRLLKTEDHTTLESLERERRLIKAAEKHVADGQRV